MIIRADARQIPLIDGCVQTVVTSPPYFGLRDYGNSQQIGLETTPDAYVASLVAVFAEVWRVLRDDGTCWVNLGDSYAGSGKGDNPEGSPFAGFHGNKAREKSAQPNNGKALLYGAKPKDLLLIPARSALALQAWGWYLRSDIIWAKPNPMPESVTDRPTKAHEYIFLLTKNERYFYDADAISEPVSVSMLDEVDQGYEGPGLKDYESAGVQNPSSVKARIIANARKRAEYQGKNAAADPQHSGRRMLANVAAKRAEGALHDSPFGLTRNRRTVWTVNTQPYKGSHFATIPEALVEPCILAGCPVGGLVFDPFLGSGTVGAVAARLGRRCPRA